MLSHAVLGELLLLTCAWLFGISFTFQRMAMVSEKPIGPLTYNAGRFVCSSIFLILIRPYMIQILHSKEGNGVQDDRDEDEDENNVGNRVEGGYTSSNSSMSSLLFWGGICGTINFVGSCLQQEGLVTVSAGKTGFITGMYVVIIPIAERFLPCFGGTLTFTTCTAALISFVGLYFLSGCYDSDTCLGGAIGLGEIIVFCSTICWVFSILFSDVAAKRCEVVSFTIVEFLVPTILCILLAYMYEPQEFKFPFHSIVSNWFFVMLVGITDALGFMLSTLGQTHVLPSRASLILSLEAATAAICGYVFLLEVLTLSELFGCLLMFGATAISTYEGLDRDDEVSSSDEESTKSNVLNTSLELPTIHHTENFKLKNINAFDANDNCHSYVDKELVILSPIATYPQPLTPLLQGQRSAYPTYNAL